MAASLVTGCSESAPRETRPAIINHAANPNARGLAIGDSFFGLSEAEIAKRLDKIKALGTIIRLDFDWAQIQPDKKDSYKWDETDHIVAAAKKRGIAVLAMVGFAPTWARDPACVKDYGCAPHDPTEFATFAGAVAEHYKDDVGEFEIWNEPNIETFFAQGPNAIRYAHMLSLASAAIKAAVPDAKVASGGLAPAYDDGKNIAPVTFLRQMYAAGAGTMDAVALHPYSYPATPKQDKPWSAFTQIEGGNGPTDIPTIHGIMAANGNADKEVWLTEYGAPTGGSGKEATLQDQHFDDFDSVPGSFVSPALQAAMIDQYLHYDFKDTKVTMRLVYTLADRRAVGASKDPEDYFGVYQSNGTPKKAVSVFKR